MKKILITAPHLISHGGGEQLVLNFFNHFKKKNKVELWTWKINKEKTFPEFTKNKKDIKIIGKETNYLEKLITWMNLDCSTFDSVLAGGFPSYFCSWKNKNVFAKIMIIPAYVTNPILTPLKLIDGMLLKKCKGVIVDCKSMQNKMKQIYGCDSKVISPGIELNLYKEGKFENYFLHVSRLDREKNVDKLVKEWNLKTRLVLVGDGKEDYKKELINLAKGKNVEFLGNKNKKELAKLYSNCTAVLLAAEDEPFGLVVLEGMASGKPIIAINKGGPTDTVKKEFGFLCESQEEIVLKTKYLAENLTIAKKMGKLAFKESKKYALKDYLNKIEREII